MVWPQNEVSRGSSGASSPCLDLNHWRSSSIKVTNEIETLNFLKSLEFNKMNIPVILDENENSNAELENIKPKRYNQSSTLNNLQIDALNELYTNTNKTLYWKDLDVFQLIKDNIKSLGENGRIVNKLIEKDIKVLIQKKSLLLDYLGESEKIVSVSLSHGDFTPWNMYLTKEKLHVFDWELSEKEMPLMYDLYHYVFQSEIMIKHNGYKQIQESLKDILKKSNIKLIIKKFDIDFNKNYTFYLVYTISYYLNKYASQNKLHDQVFWMLKVWDDALSDLLNKKGFVFNEE